MHAAFAIEPLLGLPICVASWRRRSIWIGLVAHLIVNNIFVLMVLADHLAE